jgi:hypothetical protein
MAFSQIESGIYLGTNSTQLDPSALLIEQDAVNKYSLAIKNSNYGFHAGIYFQAEITSFYLQTGIYLQTNSYDYTLTDIYNPDNEEQILNERFNNVDIPISIGFKFLFFRIYTGPTANIYLSSSSDLNEMNGFEQNFKPVGYSYHLGVGINAGRFRFDTKWEQNLSNYADAIIFQDISYKFDERPSRLFFSIGYRF